MSEIPEEAFALQAEEEEAFRWNFKNVQVVDEQTLACTYHGHSTTILHCTGSPKLWEYLAWWEVRRNNAYIRLLRRLLVGNDIAIQVSPDRLPIWLRPSIPGQLSRYGLYILNATISKILSAKSCSKTLVKIMIKKILIEPAVAK